VAEHSGDERLLSGALSDLMLCLQHLGEFARMGPYAERKLEVDERIGEPVPLAVAYVFLGQYAFLVGDWSRSRALYLRCDAIARRLDAFGSSVNSAYAPYGLGRIELAEGRAREAEQHLERALAYAQQFDDLRAQRGLQLLLAERDLLAGRAAMAHARLVPLLDQEPGKEEAEAVPLLPLVALAELEMGTEDRAASTVEESVRRATRQAPRALADALRVRALLAIKRGGWQAAQDALEETLSRTRAMPYPWAEAKALFVFGQLHAAQGEPERAREQYTAALSICARLGEGLYRPHIEGALAALDP
jgi:tetratricopeptide (TPR) repeat protein